MAAFVVPAAFEHIEEAFEVGVGIGMGMIDRMADAGLCRHVNDMREGVLCEQRRDVRPIERSACTNSNRFSCRNSSSRDCLRAGS